MMSNKIKFLLNGTVREVDFNTSKLRPSTTLLNYLRSFSETRGTKEGCAEGDCGACTVVIGKIEEKRIKYYSVDSCLVFLASVHGKQIITVEGLERRENGHTILHPVQQSLIKHYGSQCGFCTPGIVMSVFALYKNHPFPNRDDVVKCLSGNLCRCTGYEPILNAALEVCSNHQSDHFDANEKKTIKTLEEILRERPSAYLSVEDQKYFLPENIQEALELREAYPNARVVNGATDTAIRQNKFHEYSQEIIDLSAITEIKRFDILPNGFYIGAGASIDAVKSFSVKNIPTLLPMLDVFASQQIRNVATIGGNLATTSPIGDTIPLLMAHDAKIELASASGGRMVEIGNFIEGYRRNCLKSNELIKGIFIPKLAGNAIIKSVKVSTRRQLDISTVSLCARIELNTDTTMQNIVLAYGGMAETVKRAGNTEKFLQGKPFNRHSFEAAMEIVSKEFSPISDARGSAEFRITAAKNLLLKLICE